MSVKLVMYWDIKPGRDQEYFEFLIREWSPGITRLGVEPTGAWWTAYSANPMPQIMAEGLTDNLPMMQGILNSDEWKRLHERLLEFVENYSHKVVRVSGEFQL
ncbi:MAG: hypothetical protein H7Y11_00170 [Armatimonadetes bacterium]|nr:hypothetical protein [Anaerolineae bacterium]